MQSFRKQSVNICICQIIISAKCQHGSAKTISYTNFKIGFLSSTNQFPTIGDLSRTGQWADYCTTKNVTERKKETRKVKHSEVQFGIARIPFGTFCFSRRCDSIFFTLKCLSTLGLREKGKVLLALARLSEVEAILKRFISFECVLTLRNCP